LVLVLLSQTTAAQDPSLNPKTDAHRFQYPADGEVPNGFALRAAAKMALESSEFAQLAIERSTGYDKQTAHELVAYLAALYEPLMAERRAAEAQVACQANRPRPARDEDVYRLFDLVDDVHAAVDEKYYTVARAGFADTAALQAVLDDLKSGISVNIIYTAKVYEGAPPGTALNHHIAFCEERLSDQVRGDQK
jgi:hypothetical protein